MSQVNERTLVSFDWAMKNILRDKANFDVLEGFLSTLLEEEIRVLSLLESEADQQHDLDKYSRMDLLTVDDNAQILLIKLQYTWQASYMKRLFYDTSKLVVENITVGESLNNVRKVISISILYFPVNQEKDNDYFYYGKTEFVGLNNGKPLPVNRTRQPRPSKADENGAPGENQTASQTQIPKRGSIFPEYYLINVGYFQNIIRHPIDEWVYLFKNSQVREDFHSKNIQAAKEKLMVLHMSEAERKAYEQFQISRANAMDVLAGRFQEGMAQGIEVAKRDNARKMKAKGLDLALIAEISSLSEAEILAL